MKAFRLILSLLLITVSAYVFTSCATSYRYGPQAAYQVVGTHGTVVNQGEIFRVDITKDVNLCAEDYKCADLTTVYAPGVGSIRLCGNYYYIRTGLTLFTYSEPKSNYQDIFDWAIIGGEAYPILR